MVKNGIHGKMVKNGKTGKKMVKLSCLSIIDDTKDDDKSLKPIVLPLAHFRGHKPDHPALHVFCICVSKQNQLTLQALPLTLSLIWSSETCLFLQ